MFLVSIALLLAAPAELTAAPAAPETAAADPAAPAAPEPVKKICKRSVDTGSHLQGRMVCMSKKRWDALARDTQKQFRDSMNQNR